MSIVPFLVSSSLINETNFHEDSYFVVSTSLKNETIPMRMVILLCQPH